MARPTYSSAVAARCALQAVAAQLTEVIVLLEAETTPQVVFDQLRDAHDHITTARHELERRR